MKLRGLVLCLVLTIPLLSQTYTGSIGGRVTDASGSVIPKVAVTVTETATNAIWHTVTNDAGEYLVSFLKPGAYSVQFAATGFKEYVASALSLQLNQPLRVDAVMQIGQVTDKVEVSAAGDQVNYTSPEIGHVVGENQLMNLPLQATNSRGRSPLLLSKLVPGVTSTSSNNSNINNFSFGGGRPVSNEILVDGLPTTNPSDETYTLTPSPDSVQEFKVITTPFSAEWGHTGGGVMILTTRSGGNDYHGSAYDLFRNRLLNARNFFQAGSTAKYVQHDPGGTFSGPVLIPKLYNGKNKTFFFADFNVTLSSQGSLYNQIVPTALEKGGDFSQSAVNGQVQPLYDPATTTKNADGTYSRTQFPGNVIPASRIDPVAAQIIKFYPNANGSFGGNNYSVTPPSIRRVWQAIARLDHNFSDNDKAFFRFGRYNPNTDAQINIPNEANNDTSGGFRDSQAVISETHVFGPSLVNDFRAGFVQEVNYDVAGGGPVPQLGLKGVSLSSFPIVNVQSMIQLGSDPSDHDRDRSWVFSDALTFQSGRHTLKMGGDFRRQMYDYYSPGKLPGSYTFDPSFSAFPGQNKTGYAFADLLLGLPTETDINIEDYTYRLNINSASLYFQDDFKVLPKLTLNLGLRWEFDGPYSEANDQFASFDPSVVNADTGVPGNVVFAGRDGAPRHFSPNIYYNFLPRIGFAWNVAPKTVIRGGYGIYRFPSIGFSSYGPTSQYTVNAAFTSLDNNVTPAFQLADGVPPYSYDVNAAGLPNVPASLTNPTSNVKELETRSRTPYTQNWEFGIQRQISNSWFAEVDYEANKGTKLPVVLPQNQLLPSQFGPGKLQSLRPFPQYLNVNALLNEGNSIYHSLQAKLEHRWTSGFLISVAYTFSKLIDDVDGPARTNAVGIQNVYDLKAERGIGGYDIPQRFVANYVYQIPIGRGGKYLSDTPVLKDIIGGWSFAGITEFQVGLPLTVKQASNNLGGFTAVQRPMQTAPAALGHFDRSVQRWFDTSAFEASPQFALGDAPRFPLHGPGIDSTDFALMRDFKIEERFVVQFRGEFYNALNHPNFNAPGNTIGASNFGVITGAQSGRVTELALRIFF